MLLSDHQITDLVESGELGITPFSEAQVQPASYDVRLAPELRLFSGCSDTELDVEEIPEGHSHPCLMPETGYVLLPGEFVLGCTREVLRVPPSLAATVEGKSSLGRIGLAVHVTAGFVDPGFEGQVTLEIVNLLNRPIRLRTGMPIGQVAFMRMDQAPRRPYGKAGNRYQGQMGPTESRYRM